MLQRERFITGKKGNGEVCDTTERGPVSFLTSVVEILAVDDQLSQHRTLGMAPLFVSPVGQLLCRNPRRQRRIQVGVLRAKELRHGNYRGRKGAKSSVTRQHGAFDTGAAEER
jgi:hypothetical protein